MDRVDYESSVLQELINADRNKELDLSPWYQRRSVWTRPQKSYLVNTVLEGKPVPTIYIRHRFDLDLERTVKEVVDGQQRLRSIFEFRSGDFSTRHPTSGKHIKFNDLSATERERFLMSKLSVGYLIGATDSDVIEIFGRINSVSKTLNYQEKRNALFSGEFKQFCLSEAAKRVRFWKDISLFSANDISRMAEVQFVSELAISLVKGLSDGSQAIIDATYKEFDEGFPKWKSTEKKFNDIFGRLATLPSLNIADTIFNRQPLFFSLFVALASSPSSKGQSLKKAILAIDEIFQSAKDLSERPKKDIDFIIASTSTTQRLSQRKARHNYILSFLR